MPQFIFAAAAWLLRPPPPRTSVRLAGTRGRDATRRLRAYGGHEPYVDLGPLDLTRRH
jgi:hypothetical protein